MLRIALCSVMCALIGMLAAACVAGPTPAAVEQWTPRGPVAGINTDGAESAPHLRHDGLELFFVRGTGGTEDIYVTTRATPTLPWAAPVEVGALNSDALDQTPTLSPDGMVMYISSRRSGAPGPWWIYESTRVDVATQDWTTPVEVASLNYTLSAEWVHTAVGHVVTSVGGQQWIAIHSHRADTAPPGMGGNDIQFAVRGDAESLWAYPENAGVVNSNDADEHPTLSGDLLEMFFDSQRDTPGLRRIFRSTRASVDETFGPALRVAELDPIDPSDSVGYPQLSADGTTLYYYSSATGNGDIHRATR